MLYTVLILLFVTYSVVSFVPRTPFGRLGRKFLPKMQMEGDSQGEDGIPRPERSLVPQRNDICRIYFSGIVGVEPKETYLKHGHYVVNFAIATVGHFTAQHDWEKYKPTETTWLSCEIWDSVAKSAMADTVFKGAKVSGMGTLILNKWVDKQTGEDRRALKVRVLKFLSHDELEDIEIANGLPDDYSNPPLGGDQYAAMDSGFSQVSPDMDDQTVASAPRSVRAPRPSFSDMSMDDDGDDSDGGDTSDPRIPF